MAIKQITSVPSISPEGKSIAKIREVRGKSLAWNQLVQNGNFSDGTDHWSRTNITDLTNGIVTHTSPATGTAIYKEVRSLSTYRTVIGHKYLYRVVLKSNNQATKISIRVGVSSSDGASSYKLYSDWTFEHWFHTAVSATGPLGIRGYNSDDPTSELSFSFTNVNIIDLTLMFGAGNEPETVEEFETMFPENYYEYNSGEIINSNINAIEAVGFNQWDEEWELGTYNTTTGEKSDTAGYIRSINVIKVLPDVNYYIKKPASFATRVLQYDSLGNYLGYLSPATAGSGNILSFVENTAYIKFHIYLTTYNHDICINLSDPSRNSTYKPYKKSTLPLNISTLTGKLNGEGESVIICSDGLKSAGSVYDYGIIENGYLTKIVKRIGVVDMGTLTFFGGEVGGVYRWICTGVPKKVGYLNLICTRYETNSQATSRQKEMTISGINTGSNIYICDSSFTTAEAFMASLSGVMLYYELDTPQTYVLDTPILMEYSVDGGTEQIVFSENLLSTPLVADIDYFNNAIKHIQFNEEKHCIRDERITGIDYIPIEQSTNVITSAGVYNAIPIKGVKIFYGTCATAAATAAKVVVCPEFTENDLDEGTIIYVKFSSSNSAAVADLTLNVNNTGAFGIKKVYNSSLTNLNATGEIRATVYQFMIHKTEADGVITICWKIDGLDYNSDNNTVGYVLRTNYTLIPTRYKFYRYRLLFCSPDNTELIPANTSTSTNATATRDVVQDKINPFGPILYYATTTAVDAGANPNATYLWQQSNLALGYSFNRTGAALTLSVGPVYLKCAPQTDGSAIIDADTPYVQTLPNTEDGKIYIYLGQAYNTIYIELVMCHPIYYYKNGAIRIWTNKDDSDVLNAAQIAAYNEIHPKIGTTQPQDGFEPNMVYDLGTITGSVTFALVSPTDNTIANPYHWTFETGSTAPTITWPNGLTWARGTAPTIAASKHYEVLVRNGYANVLEF